MRILVFEGTAKELAEADELLAWLRARPTATPSDVAEPVADASHLSDEVRQFIRQRAANDEGRQRLVTDFLEQAIRRGGIEVEAGKSRSTSDGLGNYLMLRAAGPRRLGAIAYVTPGPGTVSFRLNRRYAADSPFAQELGVKDQNQYQVLLRLGSTGAVAEALRLADLALEKVRVGGE